MIILIVLYNFYIEQQQKSSSLEMRTLKLGNPLEKPSRNKYELVESNEESSSSGSSVDSSSFQLKCKSYAKNQIQGLKTNKMSSHKSSLHVSKNVVREEQKIVAGNGAKNKKGEITQKKKKKDRPKTVAKGKNQPNDQINEESDHRKDFVKTHDEKIITKEKTSKKANKPTGKAIQSKKEKKKDGKMVIDLRRKPQSTPTSTKATQRGGQNMNFKLRELPSFRQYCIIKGMFVPLESTSDRKCLDNMFADTACTSPDPSHNRFAIRNQEQTSNLRMVKMAKVNRHASNLSQIGIETIKTELAHYEVLVKAAQEDIGIQYSDRLNAKSSRREIDILKQIKDNAKLKLAEMESSSAQLTQAIKSTRSSLLQMMMKLQSLELNENQIFQDLNTDQKRHFRLVFESLISKMKSPRIESAPHCNRQQSNQIHQLKYGNKEQIEQQTVKEELEGLLILRESKQNSVIKVGISSAEQVDTSLDAVLATFQDIFCYTQMNCEQGLLQTMNSLYGLSYTEKYRYISKFCTHNFRNPNKEGVQSISNVIKMEVMKRQAMLKALPENLFVCFMKEVAEEEDQAEESCHNKENLGFRSKVIKKQVEGRMDNKSYFWIHSKVIFDCLNELLVPYRPFFPTKGDPFPWTISPLKCLTFYAIDSESLQTVVEQMKQKISKTARYLCGIHIDNSIYVAEDYALKEENCQWQKDIVFGIRREKLSRAIIDEEAQGADDSYLEMEVESTCVLHQISLLIWEELANQLSIELRHIRQ